MQLTHSPEVDRETHLYIEAEVDFDIELLVLSQQCEVNFMSASLFGPRMADSGQPQMPKIILTCLLTVGSYLLAFL